MMATQTKRPPKRARRGVVEGQPFDEYLHGGKEDSFSYLKHMAVNPATYHYFRHAKEKPETDAMRFGTALHACVLEPDKATQLVAIAPEGMVRNAKHAAYKEFLAEHPGKTILTYTQGEILGQTMKAVRSNDMLLGILRGLTTEVSLFWRHKFDTGKGIALRARLDGYNMSQGLLVDLKSIQAIDDRTLQRQFAAMKYPAQDAIYEAGAARSGLGFRGFLFICISTSEPYGVRMVTLTENDKSIGWDQCLRWLALVQRCRETGIYPGYGNQVDVIEMPPYYGTEEYDE